MIHWGSDPYLLLQEERIMTTFVTLEQIDQAADAIRKRTSYRPRVGLILGSGLNSLADSVNKPDILPSAQRPNRPISTVKAYVGRLVIGELEGRISGFLTES